MAAPQSLLGQIDRSSAHAANLNLSTLQRKDEQVIEVVGHSSHVTVYALDVNTKTWERKGMEGSLFIVRRSTNPVFKMMVLNRLGFDHMSQALTSSFKVQRMDDYLMFSCRSPCFFGDTPSDDRHVHGIWFHNAEERGRVHALMERIAQLQKAAAAATGAQQSQASTPAAASASASASEASAIQQMQSQLRKRALYEAQQRRFQAEEHQRALERERQLGVGEQEQTFRQQEQLLKQQQAKFRQQEHKIQQQMQQQQQQRQNPNARVTSPVDMPPEAAYSTGGGGIGGTRGGDAPGGGARLRAGGVVVDGELAAVGGGGGGSAVTPSNAGSKADQSAAATEILMAALSVSRQSQQPRHGRQGSPAPPVSPPLVSAQENARYQQQHQQQHQAVMSSGASSPRNADQDRLAYQRQQHLQQQHMQQQLQQRQATDGMSSRSPPTHTQDQLRYQQQQSQRAPNVPTPRAAAHQGISQQPRSATAGARGNSVSPPLPRPAPVAVNNHNPMNTQSHTSSTPTNRLRAPSLSATAIAAAREASMLLTPSQLLADDPTPQFPSSPSSMRDSGPISGIVPETGRGRKPSTAAARNGVANVAPMGEGARAGGEGMGNGGMSRREGRMGESSPPDYLSGQIDDGLGREGQAATRSGGVSHGTPPHAVGDGTSLIGEESQQTADADEQRRLQQQQQQQQQQQLSQKPARSFPQNDGASPSQRQQESQAEQLESTSRAKSNTTTTTTTTTMQSARTVNAVPTDATEGSGAVSARQTRQSTTPRGNSDGNTTDGLAGDSGGGDAAGARSEPVSTSGGGGADPGAARETGAEGGAGIAGSEATPMDKRALQHTLMSLIEDDRFVDMLHARYVAAMKRRGSR